MRLYALDTDMEGPPGSEVLPLALVLDFLPLPRLSQIDKAAVRSQDRQTH